MPTTETKIIVVIIIIKTRVMFKDLPLRILGDIIMIALVSTTMAATPILLLYRAEF